MSQESTVPFVVASPGPEAEGEGRDVGDGGDGADVMLDAPPGVPVPAETVLDHPTPAPLGRGRTRERERERDRSGAGFPLRLNNPAEGDLAAAAAAVAALHAATGPEAAVSVDALRTHESSPEKKAKFSSGTKMPPPAFGGTSGGESLGGRGGAKGSGHHPPLFHGGAAPPKAAATPNPLPTGAGPQVFHLDAEPPWLDAIRGDLKEIVDTQRQLAKDMALNSSELRGIQEGVRNLSIGQESLTRRADEQEASLEQMKRELREMEREVQQLRSAPPTRGPSPVSTPRNGVSAPASPRGREIDELQLVIGGWQEARRQEIEEDVKAIFAALNAAPLLKQVYVPYVRSGFCRVELVYPEHDLWKQRKLQGTVLQHIKDLNFQSRAAGQEASRLWCSRNRTQQERAKIRAILSTQALCVRHLGESMVDRDWRGKIWANSVQVLHHVDTMRRPLNTLMLVDTRGNETGWFLDVDQISGVLGVTRDVVFKHYDAE